MKRCVLTLGMLAVSQGLFAGYCGNLGIAITNATDVACTLKSHRFNSGHLQDPIPTNIPAHASTPVFYANQGDDGVNLMLVYQCGDKFAAFNSSQEYCSYSAGNVYGSLYSINDMNVDYNLSVGSYWNALPGQISWRIY